MMIKKKDKKIWNERAKSDIIPKKKVKPLPDKPIPMGGGPFVGRHTTG